MSPELETAIRERIDLGHSREQITEELRTAGYDDATIDQVYEVVQSGAPLSAIPAAAAPLPGAWDMFRAGWSYMLGRLDLVVLLALPSLLISLSGVAIEYGWVTMGAPLIIGIVLVVLGLIVLQFLLQLTVAHSALSAVRSTNMTLGASWRWATSNVWGWVWVATLTMCVVVGGLLLLVIPGIIISFYLTFALYAYLDEGKRGMSALQRSRELVTGRFWAIVGRIVLLTLLMFLVGAVFGLVFAFIAEAFDVIDSSAGALMAAVLDGFLTGLATVIGVSFMAQLYEAARSQAGQATAPTGVYPVLGWLGGLAIAAFTVMFGVGAAYLYTEYQNGTLDLEDFNMEGSQLEAELNALDAEERAELESFLEEFGAELDSI